MNKIDDTTLVAYTDGELDPTTVAEVEALLADDAALRERVRSLRESACLLRSAFNDAMYGPMPPIDTEAPIPAPSAPESSAGTADELGRGLRTWRVPMALAASLAALLVGGISGYIATNLAGERDLQRVNMMRLADQAEMRKALSRGLEKEVSGTTVSWENPDSGNRGSFVPVRTYKTESGQYCREFQEDRIVDGVTNKEQGIACRTDDGDWKVRLRYFDQ